MLEIRERTEENGATAKLVLSFEERSKSRLRAALLDGREAFVVLPRGGILRGGDRLRATDGTVVEIVAANEPLSVVRSSDGRSLARAAYHLGNRHVPLQIEDDAVMYEHDHVLDDLARTLGLSVEYREGPFEPEAGAYAHSHSSSHSHAHPHSGEHHE